MRRKLQVNLSVGGLKQLETELERYQEDLIYKTRLLAEKLSERGVEIARVKISDYDAIFTGELIRSLHSDYVSSKKFGAVFMTVADSKHAIFVEIGTGSNGIDTPYPFSLPDGVSWDYASGKTVRQNPITGRYYWFYPGQDGVWHYTEGLPSRPYMMETSIALMQEVVKVAKEVFR